MVGLFINTLPRAGAPPCPESAGNCSWPNSRQSQARLLAHQHVGLAEIQRAAGIGELFDTLVVFENYPWAAGTGRPFAGLRVAGVSGHDATHYPLSLVAAARGAACSCGWTMTRRGWPRRRPRR